MSNIEAIIVDGVRYDKVEPMVDDVCEVCELREVCEEDKDYAVFCGALISELGECWKRKEE